MAIWVALGIVAGLVLAAQSAINAQLRAGLGSPLWAALMSFLVGTVGLGLAMAVSRTGFPSQWPARPLVYVGGLLGAFYIVSAILLVPRLGSATSIGLFVAGQMLGSLALDHFGLLGVPHHPVSLARVAGAALVVAGVFILGRF